MSGHVSLCAINYKLQGNEGKTFQTIVCCVYRMCSVKVQSENEDPLSFPTKTFVLYKASGHTRHTPLFRSHVVLQLLNETIGPTLHLK